MTTKADKQTFRTEDLVLEVSSDIDPNTWDETKYDAFLDELCGTREYQKRAILTTLRYILGGKYKNLRQLALENFDKNDQIRQLHGSWSAMEKTLQLPDQVSCSIDLATGTGKSFVLYGLAAILLAEDKVDRVLILCPSKTIEAGLTEKFKELASDPNLRDLLPSEASVRAPKIINASESITRECICIENYHAVLQHVRSSISDSLRESSLRTAVFSDEAHHVANESGQKAKRWKEFLASSEFGFKVVVGVSGTCYVGDQYFTDVVSRYSLRQAIEERWVKSVEYVAEMPDTTSSDERWQLIYNRHLDWKKRLKRRDIKPLTIIVTKGISDCERVGEELQEFLVSKVGDPQKVEEQVLVVTSDRKHQPNIAKLRLVDDQENPVEWIVSVSMLNEGWDVKNVFQIVPHEERAFNSKLLIAQVLGRGLRRPNGWSGEDPVVTVFNHDRWSGRIRHLVNEILEIERRLSSKVILDSQFNFDVHTLDYSRVEDTSEFTKRGEYRLLTDGFVDLPTQVDHQDVSIEFERAITGDHVKFKTQIEYKTYGVEEIAEQMYQRIKGIDEESRLSSENKTDWTNYSEKFPREKFEEIVRESLKRASITGDRVTEENRQKFLQALGTLRRKKAKRVLYKLTAKALLSINTNSRPSDSTSSIELRKGDRTVFCSPETEKNVPDEQLEFYREIIDRDGDFRAGYEHIGNSLLFKTPLNLVIADGGPERKFVRQLCEAEFARNLDAWFKNTNQRFFWIEYAWKRLGKGEHLKRGEFSPDFIIKQGDWRFIVEIKDKDETKDPSIENQKKYEFSQLHFARLNEWLERDGVPVRYQFNFLTPPDYPKFFQKLKDRELSGFISSLDVALRAGEN
jgi:type III restriction enzyme